MEHHHNALHSCCFSSLAYAFTVSRENNSARAIKMRIEELLHCKSKGYKDITAFANDIIKYQVSNPGE